MDLSTLERRQRLVNENLPISREAADAYQAAVAGGAAWHREQGGVPPMAVAALAMATTMRAVGLPAGAVHTGQELAFLGTVAPGAPLQCSAHVAQNSVRRGTRFLSLRFQVTSQGRSVVEGEVAIAVAEESTAS